MPARAPRPCSQPGCGQLVADAGTRCLACRRRAGRARGTRQSKGYDARWLRTSRAHRIAYPLCEHCGQPVELTDHIVSIRDGGARYDWDNLRSLCWSCHSRRTGRDQPGGFRLP